MKQYWHQINQKNGIIEKVGKQVALMVGMAC